MLETEPTENKQIQEGSKDVQKKKSVNLYSTASEIKWEDNI